MSFYLSALVLVLVPVLVWFALRSRFPKWLSPPLYAGIIGSVFYAAIVVSAIYMERKVESDLVAFDLAHAGTELSDTEKEERQELFLKVIHDTARTFAPFTGAIFGLFYFVSIWLSILAVRRVFNNEDLNAAQ